MIVITRILQRDDPICKALYASVFSIDPFADPFHIATSLLWPQSAGIELVSHIVLYSFTISSMKPSHSIAAFMYMVGTSFADFPLFSLIIVFCNSSISGGDVLRLFSYMCRNYFIKCGASFSSGGSGLEQVGLKCLTK